MPLDTLNCIVSGLDFTMHTSSLMDLCIMGALLNAFAHEVMGSDDFYSFYDFLLMYQFLCTYVCLLLFNIWCFFFFLSKVYFHMSPYFIFLITFLCEQAANLRFHELVF